MAESQCFECHPDLTFDPLPSLPADADLIELSKEGEDVPELERHAVPGKVTVFDFYAVWCAPCLAEMPRLRMIRDAYASDDRLVIVSISADQTLQAARDYVMNNDMTGDNWFHAYSGLPSPIMER